ncbi:MAG: TetR/AcrR family transcriptional regulator [Saprospiraceae bacterium]|nr:TetR/AcrR family transcriptional regulator [Saprospiraceae bacterium]MBK8632195.1 TetR/AcrR family transcriptional regulator [Saprospiraceae bacterium]MBP7644146.1 TetR/AcrR family transcriptional regulator [Saprospiraceae bacterium]HMS69644.1 TetR/AcrR family transcriptional regulator [Saprospiraceae bacterium]
MKIPTRLKKENTIIDAAENVFGQYGFKNARMEEVAKIAGITKVTLYSYFQSKENLYMAVTYRALQSLADSYNRLIKRLTGENGLVVSVSLMENFMNFCDDHYLYSEALLDYFSVIRSSSAIGDDTKMTEALKESTYFSKVQELHNLPFKIYAREIQRGIDDGSIKPNIDPMFQTLHTWTSVVGYVKINAASGDASMPLFSLSLADLKGYILEQKREILRNY